MYSRISGFSVVSMEEDQDIDQKLEDYFLNNRSKFEEHFEEYKTSTGVSGLNEKEMKENDKSKMDAVSLDPNTPKKEGVKKDDSAEKKEIQKKEIQQKNSVKKETPKKKEEEVMKKQKNDIVESGKIAEVKK